MNEPFLEPAEQLRQKLRVAIAEVEQEVVDATAPPPAGARTTSATALLDSWRKLVPLIAPEAEPERRECPHCKRRIMRLATRCMYCLQKSSPPGAD